MRIRPVEHLFWYCLLSIDIHPACRCICLFDIARLCVAIGQIAEDSVDEFVCLRAAGLAIVCAALTVQAVFAGLSFWTLPKLQPKWRFLKYHYRAKLATLGWQLVGYSLYAYAKQGSPASIAGISVCLAVLTGVELYLTFGLYSGYTVGSRAVPQSRSDSQLTANKEVIGYPYTAPAKPRRPRVIYDIPIYDYTLSCS